jgi:hypothetical protein
MYSPKPPFSFSAPQREPLSAQEAQLLRQGLLERLPHVCVRQLDSVERILHAVEDIALELGDETYARREKQDPDWWRAQDLLDDVLDVRLALLRLKEQGSLVCLEPAAPSAHLELR